LTYINNNLKIFLTVIAPVFFFQVIHEIAVFTGRKMSNLTVQQLANIDRVEELLQVSPLDTKIY
jgi:hypothetical protein